MVPVHQLVPIIGAGGAECRRRCMGVLAQVRKKGRDLRQHNAQNHDLRRRSHPQNPTCAKYAAHLRQVCCPPAPEMVLTCAGKAADLFHSGSSSCCFVLLMPLALSTDGAFGPFGQRCHPSFPARPGISFLSFRPSPAPCHFDRAKRAEKSVCNFFAFFSKKVCRYDFCLYLCGVLIN